VFFGRGRGFSVLGRFTRQGIITYNKPMLALWIVLIILGVLILERILRKIWHLPAPVYLGYLLNSKLRRFIYPERQLIERSGIKPGMTVVDLGCGSGAYAPYVARAVGAEGKVYAVDVQAGMLRQLERRMGKKEFQDVSNIEIKQTNAYDLPFTDDSIDLVYMVAVLPEIPDRGRALSEVRRVLRTGGILAVTEIIQDPDYPWRSTTTRICQQQGFIVEASLGHFWNYTVRFRKWSG
jgi:ubiquinone/menaquinone biosynthesis C-methylase UbiE